MWIYASLSRWRIFASEKYAAALVFAASAVLRAVPELAAYPYPVGYDVVNYYIPVVAHFEQHWTEIASQFPLYVVFLHLVSLAGLPAHVAVTGVAVVMFGVFAISIFFVARSILNLDIIYSVFLALFVIVQMSVLRTAWDLHRDIFALASMMLVFCLIGRKDAGWKGLAAVLALSALAVASDRMIGMLFCVSLAAYAFVNRKAALPAGFAILLFAILMFVSYDFSIAEPGSAGAPARDTSFYNPQNLLTLFVVVNGLVAVPAVAGFARMKNAILLKVPLLVSLAGSLSWLVFPDLYLLVADRWIVLAGIFLSIFAGYGIVHLANNMKARAAIASSALAAFAAIGIAFAVMPYDSPFPLYGAARASTEDFGPVTMQFNSLDIEDNDEMISTIAWINQNTEPGAVVVGEKHWRGFMELYLEGGRTYRFSGDPLALAEALEKKGSNAYLVTFSPDTQELFVVEDIGRR